MGQKEGLQRRPPIVSGFIYLGLGLFLLWVDLQDFQDTWPILIIVVGIALMIGAMLKGKRSSDDTAPPPPPTSSID